MARIIAIVFLPMMLCQSAVVQPVQMSTATELDLMSAEQRKQMHFGCASACNGNSQCITECEAAMYACVEGTSKETEACQVAVLKKHGGTKLPEKKVSKDEPAVKAKEETKKPCTVV